MNNEFSFSGLIKLFRRNIKALLIIGLVATILSGIFSGPQFIRPKFKSTAVVYPENLFPYSIESQTEQMIQIFNATSIRDFIIDKYDLYVRWEVDTTSKKAKHYINEMYNENISVNRTNYESVIINVMDFSADTAKLIADDILEQFNAKTREIKRSKSREGLVMAEEALVYRRTKIDSIAKRLDSLRLEKNILHYDIQATQVTQGYYRMLAMGKGGAKIDEARDLLTNLETYGGEFIELSLMMRYYLDDYAKWTIQRNDFYNDVNKRLTYLSVIENPEVPVKKSYPVRWVIVVSVVMGTMLMAVVLISLFQKDNFEQVSK